MRSRKRALEQLDRDIRDHLDQDIADRIARGVPPDEARRQAHVAFGNVTLTKEDTRAVWTVSWIEQTLQDLRSTRTRSADRSTTTRTMSIQ